MPVSLSYISTMNLSASSPRSPWSLVPKPETGVLQNVAEGPLQLVLLVHRDLHLPQVAGALHQVAHGGQGAGVSFREVARRSGVSNPYLSQVETGQRRPGPRYTSYPSLVCGGEHAGIPLVPRPRVVQQLLERALTRPGFALVFDLSELREREQQSPYALAAEELFVLKRRHPGTAFMVVAEAHIFAPQVYAGTR